MTPPLTRHDLEEVLDERLVKYPTRRDLEEVLDQRLANYPTRRDLEEVLDQRLANYPTRAELRTELAGYTTHAQLAAALATQREQIAADTRATMTVLLEDAFKRFGVIDDKYADLPARVRRLEAAVFPPPTRARRKRSA